MQLTQHEVTELLKEASQYYELKDTEGWSVNGIDKQKVQLIVDIIFHETFFKDIYEKAGISEKRLREDLFSYYIPQLKRNDTLNYEALKYEIENRAKSARQTKRIFVFPSNVNLPISKNPKFKKEYKFSGIKIIWYSKIAFGKSKFNCKEINDRISKYYPKLSVNSFIIVEAKGHESQFRADVAHKFFKVFCGIINLSLMMGRIKHRYSSTQIRTVSNITGSPYFFEYINRKKYIRKWISDDYMFTKSKRLNKKYFQNFNKLASIITRFNKRYEIHDYIKDFLVLYQEAVSSPDEISSFMKFWSIIELLTFQGKNKTDYNLLINRVLSIYTKNNDLYRRKLEFLRNKRNKLVHKQIGIVTQDDLNYLRRIGEDLFEVCINLTEGYKSLDKITFILDNGQKTKKQIQREIGYLKFLHKKTKR